MAVVRNWLWCVTRIVHLLPHPPSKVSITSTFSIRTFSLSGAMGGSLSSFPVRLNHHQEDRQRRLTSRVRFRVLVI